MPYGVYTHQNVNMGACCVQGALHILKDEGKNSFKITLKSGCVC